MGKGVNQVTLIGHIGKDPELTYTQSSLAIAKFSLATTESKKNTAGNWEDKTSWHSIVLFGKTAETAGRYLIKGSQVYIEGSIDYQEWETDGVKKYRTVITGQKMQMLGGKGNQVTTQTPRKQESESEDSVLPF
jgi:single-strand DNA-binding protein